MERKLTKCEQCGGPSDNEGRACAGACAEERAQNVPEVQIGHGLPGCTCCDTCRDKCLDDFIEMEENEERFKGH